MISCIFDIAMRIIGYMVCGVLLLFIFAFIGRKKLYMPRV